MDRVVARAALAALLAALVLSCSPLATGRGRAFGQLRLADQSAGRAGPDKPMAMAEALPPGPTVKQPPFIPGVDANRFYYIDLPTAFQLAGARNPHVAFAREQVREAMALQ